MTEASEQEMTSNARSRMLRSGFVTTSRKVRKRSTAFAEQIATQVGIPYIEQNGSMRFMRDRHDADFNIVVSSNGVKLAWDDGEFRHHPGMAVYRVGVATGHPFLAALEPRIGDRTLDSTLGLGRDALVVADRTENLVQGVEQNPVIATLTHLGLQDLKKIRRFRAVVPRIRVRRGDGYKSISRAAYGWYDHVLLDPMFPSPVQGSSDMEFLHKMVEPIPFRNELIRRACSVARKRVVLRWPSWIPCPDMGFTRVVPGSRNSFYFLVMDLQRWETRRRFAKR